VSLLKSVDLPTLYRPTMATKGSTPVPNRAQPIRDTSAKLISNRRNPEG
jgi:hypothetical protein